VERLPDAQVEVELQPRLLRMELVRELDLKRLGIDLDNRTLAPLEKVTQIVSKLGVAEPQSHPKVPPLCPAGRSGLSLTVGANDGLSNGTGGTRPSIAELLSRRGLERPCETLVVWVGEA
jgi:hypothetical protein